MNATKGEGGPMNMEIETFLAREHARFDATLHEVEYLSERGSFHLANKLFAKLKAELERHTAVEEKLFMPLFVEGTLGLEGTGHKIRAEHRRLLQLLEEMDTAISRWDNAHFSLLLRQLTALNRRHHEHEKHIFHIAFEAVVKTEAGWRQLYEPEAQPG